MEIPPSLSLCLLLLALPCDGGQFWHISDLHLDYKYTSGGNMSNWCHKEVDTETPSLNKDIVGPAGNYHCDSPAALVESALLAMQRFHPNPDFIVWTGDSAPHWRDPSPNEEYILNVTKQVFTRLDKLFPNISIIPALGNHDASPPDQFPQYDPVKKTKPEYYLKLWQNGAFGDHIDTEAMQTFQQCGFYSKVVSPINSSMKLKFIVLNTNIYYHDNYSTGADPCAQLDWLNSTLHNTDIEKEKVFIVAHVSPGSFERNTGEPNFNSPEEFKTAINKQYVQIVTDPSNAGKISAHLYGHLHTDTFRVLLDRATRREAVGVAFMAGSVTPVVWGKDGVVGVNPTIRLMEFSDEDAKVMDYKEYSLDIIKAAKNERVNGSKEPATPDDLKPKDPNEKPRSRRKNAKFLEQTVEHSNDDRTKRESIDADNPADDIPSKLPAADVTEAIAAPKVNTTTPGQFNVTAAVPVTSPPAVDAGDEAKNITVDASDEAKNFTDDVSDEAKKFTEDVSDEAVAADSINVAALANSTLTQNISADNEGKNSTQLKEMDSNKTVSIAPTTGDAVNTTEPDYPTYLSTQWTLLYNANTSFSVPDLSPTSMFSALKMMVKDGHEGQIFVNYYEHNTGGHKVEKCDETCWREQLCTVSNLVMEELATCLNSTDKKEGFYEETKQTTPLPLLVSTTRRKGFGEGDDDPDHVVHGELDHDHDGDGEEDHKHEDHLDSDGLDHDHDGDGNDDHDHQDHADHFPAVPEEKEDVSKEKLEDPTSDISSRAVAIFFGVFAVAILALVAIMGYKKYRDNRYRNQEFLLTDAVFRYDGYSQLDDA
eukprot:TRINITY_DN8417_c0_g1_i1.p1 TRINITY_DN8417_c0_g1~~TRINITY_DN8417_c0_g1_i1.p1  ORF type:complete len:822 (-),score=306.82 TRINITY_DN8417_c0_g1_i1:453-2918(-)